ncbi:MAG: hypothetical protein U1E87_07940 [Alphaproteobacteria bacterium]
MRLFGSGRAKSQFAEFDTCLRARRHQRQVLEANADPRRALYETLLGKRGMPLFTGEIRQAQGFADFKLMKAEAEKMGLARFFRPVRGWFGGGKR